MFAKTEKEFKEFLNLKLYRCRNEYIDVILKLKLKRCEKLN